MVEIIALLFVILFLYTGIAKLMDYSVAKEQIGLTPLFAPIAKEIVIFLPILEIITAVLLFIPRTRRVGLYSTLILLFAFTGYVIYILTYNDTLPCTCGGVLEQMSWTQHIIFNTGCIIFAIIAILLNRSAKASMQVDAYSIFHGSKI